MGTEQAYDAAFCMLSFSCFCLADPDALDREVYDPESMGILVAALIAGFFLAGLLLILFVAFRIYRCKRRYEKSHGIGSKVKYIQRDTEPSAIDVF